MRCNMPHDEQRGEKLCFDNYQWLIPSNKHINGALAYCEMGVWFLHTQHAAGRVRVMLSGYLQRVPCDGLSIRVDALSATNSIRLHKCVSKVLTDHSRFSRVFVRQLQLYSFPSEAVNLRWRELRLQKGNMTSERVCTNSAKGEMS